MTSKKNKSASGKKLNVLSGRKNKYTKSDELFKLVMNDKVAATEFLEEYLPSNVRNLVDLSTIKVEKESYVQDNLKKLFSDVVISVKMNNTSQDNAFIYCLAEHQSEPDYWMSLRIFEYMLQLCRRHVKKNKRGKLPLVIPVILYHGKQTYNAPRNIYDLFVNPKIAKEILTQDYQVIDVQHMSDDEIKNKKHLGMLLYMMSHIHDRNMVKVLEDFLSFFEHLLVIEREKDYTYLKHLLFYTHYKTRDEDQAQISNILQDYLSKHEDQEIMRTVGDVYEEEFYNKWVIKMAPKFEAKFKAEGKAEGIEETALRMLEEGIDTTLIKRVTGLSDSAITQIRNHLLNLV